MRMSKTTLALGVSASLLFGCNSDGLPGTGDNPGSGTGSDVTLTNGMWQLGYSGGGEDPGLPNVYVFADDGSHKYYDDDANEGTYEIKDASLTSGVSSQVVAYSDTDKISFKWFDASGSDTNATPVVNASTTIEDGTLTITSADGSFEPISSSDKTNEEGIKDAVSDANEEAGIDNAVLITDTNKDGKEDTGELRIKVAESKSNVGYSMASGKVSLDLVYQRTEGSTIADVNENKVYITLYNDLGTSNSYHHGEISFGVEQGSTSGPIFYRDASGSLVSTGDIIQLDENGVYTANIEVEWTPNSHNFSINDVSYDGAIATPGEKVQVVAVRFGNNSKMTPYEIIIDNLVISEPNAQGDYVEVFADNFNARPVGQELNSAPYNNNSYEAVVISLTGEEAPVEPEVPVEPVDNQVAAITDQDSGDTGELRYKFDSGMTTGTHKVSMFYDVNETESAYVSLFDSANSTNSLIGELKLDEGKVTLRGEVDEEGKDVQVTTFTPGQWVDLEMSWDTSSTTEVGTYFVKINGTEFGPFDSQNITPGVEVTATAIKFSSNTGIADTTLYVDDYEVYSDSAGTAQIFSDDFESYSLGTDLTSGTAYNSSSFSAIVAGDPLSGSN